MIRNLLSVGGFTLLSRITGFARDIVLAATLGAGLMTDAFVVAFRLPNHFRAIFGEGAFNAAFVPSYARVLETEGAAEAQKFSSRIFTLLLASQIVLLVLALAFAGTFTTGSIVAFLTFGPMVDIKSALMFLGVFRRRIVVYLIVLPLLLTMFIGILWNLVLLS